MERIEFGHRRTSCACNDCTLNCRHMPGMLIPSDLTRVIPAEVLSSGRLEDVFKWAYRNLLASPGALVMKGSGEKFRIPTLVPATKEDGSCIHLTAEGRCGIHEVAPFGCAFFDCGVDPGISADGLIAIAEDNVEGGLYTIIWRYLDSVGKRQHRPDVLRARMARVLESNRA